MQSGKDSSQNKSLNLGNEPVIRLFDNQTADWLSFLKTHFPEDKAQSVYNSFFEKEFSLDVAVNSLSIRFQDNTEYTCTELTLLSGSKNFQTTAPVLGALLFDRLYLAKFEVPFRTSAKEEILSKFSCEVRMKISLAASGELNVRGVCALKEMDQEIRANPAAMTRIIGSYLNNVDVELVL